MWETEITIMWNWCHFQKSKNKKAKSVLKKLNSLTEAQWDLAIKLYLIYCKKWYQYSYWIWWAQKAGSDNITFMLENSVKEADESKVRLQKFLFVMKEQTIPFIKQSKEKAEGETKVSKSKERRSKKAKVS